MTCANRITVFRLLLVPVFCGLVFVYSPALSWARHAALAVYVLAALSDALDGYVARRWERPTPLGKRLDPLADKLLINLGFVFLAANPHVIPSVPMWFPVPLLLRDSIIVLGALLLNAFVAPVIINVRVTGKLTTLFLNITLVTALLGLSQLPWLIGATTLLVAASCAAYIYDGIQQVKSAGGQNLA